MKFIISQNLTPPKPQEILFTVLFYYEIFLF